MQGQERHYAFDSYTSLRPCDAVNVFNGCRLRAQTERVEAVKLKDGPSKVSYAKDLRSAQLQTRSHRTAYNLPTCCDIECRASSMPHLELS